jgi:hypothetical protein
MDGLPSFVDFVQFPCDSIFSAYKPSITTIPLSSLLKEKESQCFKNVLLQVPNGNILR